MRILVLFGALLLGQGFAASFGDKEKGVKVDPPKTPKPLVQNLTTLARCDNCHSGGRKDPTDMVRGVEWKDWVDKDKHKEAWIVLTKARAQQMAKILGYAVEKDKRCISCHGTAVNVGDKDQMKTLEDYGVNCTICHGPSEDWISAHPGATMDTRNAWRSLSRVEKESKWGMYDLWDPAKRTKLCGSCHIGSAKDGKVVTHEMYAAGHPPLPGFEVATFSEQMPRHWESLRERAKDKMEDLKRFYRISKEEIDLELTHQVGVGALMTFRMGVDLIGEQAKKGDSWPELAVFDCFACHHDLQNPSWRQERGYKGKPGRPQLRAWSAALVDLGLLHAARGDKERAKGLQAELDKKMGELAKTFDARPFGAPERVTASTSDVSKWIDSLLNGKGERYPADLAKRLVRRLEPLAEAGIPDFDSARQMAWAFGILESDGAAGWSPKGLGAEGWKSLTENLSLKLPGKSMWITEKERGDVKFYLETSLKKLNDYQPRQFREDFRKLFEGKGP
ncbi:MAG: multiheme c-type cytochrome [Gemmataceae bacterium]